MTPGKNWPCLDCEKHTPTCHGECEIYLEAKENLEAARRPEKTRNIIVGDYVRTAIEQTRGSHGGKISTYRPKERR
jgi:hypothetical protein